MKNLQKLGGIAALAMAAAYIAGMVFFLLVLGYTSVVDPAQKVASLLESNEALVSLDDDRLREHAGYKLDRIQDVYATDPERQAITVEAADLVGKLLARLNPQEQMIIERRFGLRDGERSTLQQIGQQLHITRERVRQLESRALRKLRVAVTRCSLDRYFD